MNRQVGVIPAVHIETQQREEARKKAQEKGWLVSVPLTTFPVHWLYDGEQRLDGRYYADEAFGARRLLEDSGLVVKPLGELANDLFYPGRFKRVYAKTEADGMPFLTPTQALHFRPDSEKFLAYTVKQLDSCKVKPGWILVTRSGTVGRPVIVSDRLARFAISDDMIRVQVEEQTNGYLYAYLSSWIGQALMVKDQYGSAIKHLEPHHLAGIRVPILPHTEQGAIHDEIMRAYSLRDEANDLLDQAEKQLYHNLGLSAFDPEQATYMSPPPRDTDLPAPPPLKAFTTPAAELDERLDASYHIPIAHAAVRQLRAGKYSITSLASLVDSIFLPSRFKRIYVTQEYGVPFLQGSHLPQKRPLDLQYLSKEANARHIEQCRIRQGWVLVTRSGTVGRTTVVSENMDGWAASEHMLRIVPDREKGHPGYLATFLKTPYGQHQLKAKIYGGVVDELTETDTADVLIPSAPLHIQKAIGEKVVAAYKKKDEANTVEDTAIQHLEHLLEKYATRES